MQPPMTGDPDGPVIVRIGAIEVTSTTVRTPVGVVPLRGTQWMVTDQWVSSRTRPRWAVAMTIASFCLLVIVTLTFLSNIILAVIGFVLLLFVTLAFLRVKHDVYTGVATISVSNGPTAYVARVAVATTDQVQQVYNQVNYARSLSLI